MWERVNRTKHTAIVQPGKRESRAVIERRRHAIQGEGLTSERGAGFGAASESNSASQRSPPGSE